MNEPNLNDNLKNRIIQILSEIKEEIQSPRDILNFIHRDERILDFILDVMTEEELEQFGEILFGELLELIQAEEKGDKDAVNQIYG